jgi:hypothetical protein
LPKEKAGQERVIAEALASHFGATIGRPLPERDHDFELVLGGGGAPQRVVVQATEVTFWDFLRPITQEEYDNGPGSMVISVPIDDPFAVAQVALAERDGLTLAAPNVGVPVRARGRIIIQPKARPFAVDEANLHRALLKKIEAKAPRYAKPNDGSRLWLLVWTVCSGFVPFWSEGGKARVSPGVELARAKLARNGAGPFDEVWFMQYVG